MGLGLSSLVVSSTCLVTKWFAGKELALALGINTGVSRLGAAVIGLVVPELTNSVSIGFASLLGVIICGVALVACIVNGLVDAYSDDMDGAPEPIRRNINCGDIKRFGTKFWLITAITTLSMPGSLCYIWLVMQ